MDVRGREKKRFYLVTFVDRATRCFLAWHVRPTLAWEALQDSLDTCPPATRYFSDGFVGYRDLLYPTPRSHAVAPGKSETYSVEAGNAELRHYLARLSRCNRCFNRCAKALQRAVWLFVLAWNTRQLHNRAFPNSKKHLIECLPAIK